MDKSSSSNQTMWEDIKEDITTLKEHIGQGDIKQQINEHVQVFVDLNVNKRIKITQIAEFLGIPLSTLRSYLSHANFNELKTNNTKLNQQIIDYYNKDHTLTQCQNKFKIGFPKLKEIIGIHERKRGIQLTANLNIDSIKNGYRQRLKLKDLAIQLCLTEAQLKRFIYQQGYQYTLESLFGRDIQHLYLEQNQTKRQIADEFGVSVGTIHKLLRQKQIKKSKQARTKSLINQTRTLHNVDYYSQTPSMRAKSKSPKKKETAAINKELLRRYINSDLTLAQIGRLLNVSDLTIAKYLDRFDIPYESKENRLIRLKNEAARSFKEQSFERWGKRFRHLSEYQDSKTKMVFECSEHVHTFEQLPTNHLRSNGCKFCQPSGYSKGEKDLVSFIRSIYKGEVIENDRTQIYPKELDVFIPEFNLAIEFNGLFWHSFGLSDEIDKKNHLTKTELCNQKGIKLLHVFEHEWQDAGVKLIWESIIKGHLFQHRNRVFARKTTLKRLTQQIADQFCDYNHMQGSCYHSVAYGLYSEDTLVSVATFGPTRFKKNKNQWEIIRFCSKLNWRVVGGLSKLLSFFVEHHTDQLISYANRRWSIGDVYDKIGMKRIGTTSPNYFYTKDCKSLQSRHKFQKHKLKKLLSEFNPDVTEMDNMLRNGYRIIFDSGNIIYEYTRNS